MRTRRPERLKTFAYLGNYRYFLTFCTDRRKAIFRNGVAVDLVLFQFLRVAEAEQFAILTYCFMLDHVHLLIEGLAESSDARKFIKKGKQCSAHAYAATFGARLWQPFGYERVLRSDESVIGVARYIVENPVRAGLVETVQDYPFVGSRMCDVKDLVATLPDRVAEWRN